MMLRSTVFMVYMNIECSLFLRVIFFMMLCVVWDAFCGFFEVAGKQFSMMC